MLGEPGDDGEVLLRKVVSVVNAVDPNRGRGFKPNRLPDPDNRVIVDWPAGVASLFAAWLLPRARVIDPHNNAVVCGFKKRLDIDRDRCVTAAMIGNVLAINPDRCGVV